MPISLGSTPISSVVVGSTVIASFATESIGSPGQTTVVPLGTPPAAITDLAATVETTTDLLLSWSEPSSSPSISEYEVEYFAVAPEYAGGDNEYTPLTPNPSAGETSRQYTIPEAAQSPGESLSVSLRIRAVNSAGAAEWSNIETVYFGP